MKSNIPFGGVRAGSELEQSANSTSSKSATVENGQQEMLSMPKDVNPVTGEGYNAVANGDKESPPTPPAPTTTNGTGNAEIRRNCIPPGSYSSGLW
jgi:hypothetical protein